ncbi:MAG: methionine aminotransferase [Bacteroidales bacterium]
MNETKVNTNSKLPNFNTSIFATMSQLAEQHQAVNLSQGFPDFNCPEELINRVCDYIKKGENQYAPMKGVEGLREIIGDKFLKLHGKKYHPDDEITITAGATQGIFSAITAFVKEDDEVIIIEPAFDTYIPSIEYNKGVIKLVKSTPPDFQINWQEIRQMINNKTRMIVLNYPNNPTGKNISEEDLEMLYLLIKDTDIIVLSDEVYEHILFDNQKHVSIATHKKLSQRSVIISSFGKTFNITGWKTGYCLAPAKLTREFRKAHQNIVFAANRPMQLALADYMQNEENYLGLNNLYQKKRDYFIDLLKDSRFKVVPSEGTFYQLADFSAISNKTDFVFAKELIEKHHVASVPLSAFYHRNNNYQYIRFCFAKSDETLKKAAEILCRI